VLANAGKTGLSGFRPRRLANPCLRLLHRILQRAFPASHGSGEVRVGDLQGVAGGDRRETVASAACWII
jgi:hypothetical protein